MVNQFLVNDNRREYLDFLVRDSVIPLSGGVEHESLEHFLKKCEIAKKLVSLGHVVCVEGKLKSGFRPDVLVLDVSPPVAYEVVCSESDESLLNKIKNYGDIIIKIVRI